MVAVMYSSGITKNGSIVYETAIKSDKFLVIGHGIAVECPTQSKKENNNMYNDRDLQRSVMDELDWEPGVNASDIGASIKDGVVTLTGLVDSYSEKLAAERGAKRLIGVRAVADEIEVRLPGDSKRPDADIARTAENVLDWNTTVPNKRIKLTIENGWITLEGMVDWQYQRLAAEKAVRHLTGVRGISNQIILVSKATPAEINSKIEAALERSAKVDAKGIKVEIIDNKVILSGNVRSWAEREEAERAAWATPGGCEVENNIRIDS
jgi:osmotically-inducible protein OsmY